MKCFYHDHIDAVGTCQTCGKTLCKECAGNFTPCTCMDCYQTMEANRQEDYKQNLNLNIGSYIFCAVVGIVLAVLLRPQNDFDPVLHAVWTFSIPFGWKALSYIQSFLPIYILGNPYYTWAIVITKVVLSVLLGPVLLPYYTVKTILSVRNKKSMK